MTAGGTAAPGAASAVGPGRTRKLLAGGVHTALTPVALVPLVLAVIVGYLAGVTRDGWLWALTCALAGLVGTALVWRPRLRGLAISLPTPYRTAVGEVVDQGVLARNTGSRRTSSATLSLPSQRRESLVLALPSLAPGESARLTVPRRALHRGTGELVALVTSTAPFGLVHAAALVQTPWTTIIHPRPVAIRPPAPRPGTDGDALPAPSRSGADVHAVRPWRQGDLVRDVHWRATARRGSPVVVERESPALARLALLVVGEPADPGFEDVVAAAAATASAARGQGRGVLLLAPGNVPALATPGPYEPATPTAALDWASQVERGRPATVGELAAVWRWLGPGDLLVAASQVPVVGWAQELRRAAHAAGARLGWLVEGQWRQVL